MDDFKRVSRNAQEIVTAEELNALLASGRRKAYIGFEPSGTVHLGWKITTDKVRDMVDAGFEVDILLADWHAYINDKLGGDLDSIKACGKYMEDCFEALGVPREKVNFVYASDIISDPRYWELVIKVAKNASLSRIKRAMDIMGRSADDAERDMSKFLYPAMQVADIFYLNVDLAYGGMDQRHAHMLCRDVAAKLGFKPPVALHTPLLSGLQAGGRMDPLEAKMSKSKPDSGIFIHDSEEEVTRKLNKAYCQQGEVEGNPVLQLAKYIIFPGHLEREGRPFVIDRPEKFGGKLEFADYGALESAFIEGLHPLDLKKAAARYINEILQPVSDYFGKHPQNLEKMRDMNVTR